MQSGIMMDSAKGDVRLKALGYVVHGTSNAADGAAILGSGFQYFEGRPTLSTNMVHAADWTTNEAKQAQSRGTGTVTGEPGMLVILQVPATATLGYGVFTSANIDRTLKRVSGAPLRFAAARKQLALYQAPDWESRRQQIEAALAGGPAAGTQPTLSLPLSANVGVLNLNGGAATVIEELGSAAFDLSDMNLLETAKYLVSEVQLYEHAIPSMLSDSVAALVLGTIESVVMSRLRMLRWQGLAGLGFTFWEGEQEVTTIAARPPQKQLEMLKEYSAKVSLCPMLTNELAWLKDYAHRSLDVMRVEVTGAAE